MTYIDGFVVPVPAGSKAAYRALAGKAAFVFKEHGATRSSSAGATTYRLANKPTS